MPSPRTLMELDEFPAYLENFLRLYPDTLLIEGKAERLIQLDFEFSALSDFIQQVCTWGKYSAVAGRILSHNEPLVIREAFRSAYLITASDVIGGLRTLTNLNQLA